MLQSVQATSDKATALATILEGFATLDAEEAALLTDLFIETTRKAMERHLLLLRRH